MRVFLSRRMQLMVGRRTAIRYGSGMTNQRRVGRPLILTGQLLIALGFSTCTSTADIFPLNASARAIGDPDIKFVREGIDQGPVTATMPDGEVLHRRYPEPRSPSSSRGWSWLQRRPDSATAMARAAAGCSSCCEARAPRCCAEARSVSVVTATASARPKKARSGRSATRAVSNPLSALQRMQETNIILHLLAGTSGSLIG